MFGVVGRFREFERRSRVGCTDDDLERDEARCEWDCDGVLERVDDDEHQPPDVRGASDRTRDVHQSSATLCLVDRDPLTWIYCAIVCYGSDELRHDRGCGDCLLDEAEHHPIPDHDDDGSHDQDVPARFAGVHAACCRERERYEEQAAGDDA